MPTKGIIAFTLRAVAVVWAAQALLLLIDREWFAALLAAGLSTGTVVIVALAVRP